MATKKKAKTTKPSTKPKKKGSAKKIKVPAKKKAVKSVPNPHAGKRYFMLDLGGYGGELMVDTVPEEFVQYWLDEDRKHGLSDHIMAMHEKAAYGDDFDEDSDDEDEDSDDEEEGGFDKNSPEVSPGRKYVEYWSLDGIEHNTVLSADYGSFTVTEVELHPKAVYVDGAVDWDDKECKKRNFDWSQNKYTEKGESKDYGTEGRKHVYATEMFVHDTKKGLVDPVPVLMCYDAQKGSFFRIVVETNGEDFDVEKLVFGVCENTMTTHIHQYFYDKKPLSVDYDYLSTWGKGFHVSVGYMPKGETSWDYEELLKYGWEDLEESE